MYIGSTYLFK